MFQFAATNFGDPEAQYRLAVCISTKPAVSPRTTCARGALALAADKEPRGASDARPSAVLGDGVPIPAGAQLDVALDRQEQREGPERRLDHDLQVALYNAASEDDRQVGLTIWACLVRTCARELTSSSPPAVPRRCRLSGRSRRPARLTATRAIEDQASEQSGGGRRVAIAGRRCLRADP